MEILGANFADGHLSEVFQEIFHLHIEGTVIPLFLIVLFFSEGISPIFTAKWPISSPSSSTPRISEPKELLAFHLDDSQERIGVLSH